MASLYDRLSGIENDLAWINWKLSLILQVMDVDEEEEIRHAQQPAAARDWPSSHTKRAEMVLEVLGAGTMTVTAIWGAMHGHDEAGTWICEGPSREAIYQTLERMRADGTVEREALGYFSSGRPTKYAYRRASAPPPLTGEIAELDRQF